MVYRRVEKKDYPQIKDMIERYGISYDMEKIPAIGFVAIGNSGELVGFIFAHTCMLIEPFICDNQTSAVKLNFMMEGIIQHLKVPFTLAHIKSADEKFETEVKRAGYEEVVNADYKVFKKVN